MRTKACASAARVVGGFSLTSTIRTPPFES